MNSIENDNSLLITIRVNEINLQIKDNVNSDTSWKIDRNVWAATLHDTSLWDLLEQIRLGVRTKI